MKQRLRFNIICAKCAVTRHNYVLTPGQGLTSRLECLAAPDDRLSHRDRFEALKVRRKARAYHRLTQSPCFARPLVDCPLYPILANVSLELTLQATKCLAS